MLAAALREAGVPDAQIEVIPEETSAVDRALSLGRPGDLLLIFADSLQRTWTQITQFRPEDGATFVPVVAPVAVELPAAPEFRLEAGFELKRDERGVRIAREIED
jgi:cyanophycin synthetase